MSIPVPLGKLELSPLNVRQADDGSGTTDLEASILAHGMLSPLIVHTIKGPKGKATGRYGVLAGGRRLRALQALRDREAIPADHAVEVVVRDEGEGRATEISVIENTARVALPPIEEFRAFAKLAEDPAMDTAAIAHRFGVTELHVRQRMRLGQVHPDILDAYAAGRMNLDAVKAYAATADQALQRKVFGDQGDHHSAYHIRHALQRAGSAYDTAMMLKFVGRDAYVAAGGAIEVDLFESAPPRVVHPGTLADLYFDKVEAEKAKILDAAPACVTEVETSAYTYGRRKVEFEPVLTEVQRERRSAIDARCDAIHDRIDAIAEPAEDGIVANVPTDQAEVDQLLAERDALEVESEAIIDGAEMQLPAGPVVAIVTEGEGGLRLSGYYRPEGWREDAVGGGAVAVQHRSPEAVAKADHGLTQAAIDANRITRRMVLRAALLDGTDVAHKPRAFEVATRFLVFATLRNLLTSDYATRLGADSLPGIAHDDSAIREQLAEQPCFRTIAACMLSAKDAAWINEPDLQSAFAMFDEASEHEQGFAAALAVGLILSRSLKTSGLDNAMHDQLAFMLGVDDTAIRDLWSPDAVFFDRLAKRWRIAAVAQVNPKIAAAIGKLPTSEISAACARFFTADDDAQREFGMMPGTVAHARRWVPAYLRFDDTPPGPCLWEDAADQDATERRAAA